MPEILYDFAALHKEKWLWVSENPTRDTTQWPGWIINGGTIPNARLYCFGCEAVEENCSICPLQWPNNQGCYNRYGLYQSWARAPKAHVKLAKQIAMLEWEGKKLFSIKDIIEEGMSL